MHIDSDEEYMQHLDDRWLHEMHHDYANDPYHQHYAYDNFYDNGKKGKKGKDKKKKGKGKKDKQKEEEDKKLAEQERKQRE